MPGKRGFDLLPALAKHDDRPLRAESFDAVEQMQKEWAARNRVEDLVRIRSHPRALPGGKDDNGETALVGHRAVQWHGASASASILST